MCKCTGCNTCCDEDYALYVPNPNGRRGQSFCRTCDFLITESHLHLCGGCTTFLGDSKHWTFFDEEGNHQIYGNEKGGFGKSSTCLCRFCDTCFEKFMQNNVSICPQCSGSIEELVASESLPDFVDQDDLAALVTVF